MVVLVEVIRLYRVIVTRGRIHTGTKEGDFEQNVSEIEVVCRQFEVIEEVVGVGLGNVAPVHFEGKKHNTSPYHNSIVNLPDDCIFFSLCPTSAGVKTVRIFELRRWSVYLQRSRVVEHRWLCSNCVRVYSLFLLPQT